MNHGIWLRNQGTADIDRLVEWGTAAEASGWDGVFVSDSLPGEAFPDPWAALGGIAAVTETIELGTWVVPVPRRNPWNLAQAAASVDRLSGGRVLLGAGLGNEPDYGPFGRSADPGQLAPRLDESLTVITELWSGEPVDHDGPHFTLTEATVEPTPIQDPRIPILTGCWWPNEAPFRRGARWDGIMPYFPSLSGEGTGPRGEEAAGSALEEIREALTFYGEVAENPGEIVLPTIPTADPEEYLPVYDELGATWVLSIDPDEDAAAVGERIRRGPPG